MSPDEIRERVAQWWDLSGTSPVPRQPVPCPVCRSSETMIREVRVGHREPGRYRRRQRTEHRIEFRVDVSLKCLVCSARWDHGIPIDEDDARRFGWEGGSPVTRSWREVVVS